MNTLFLHVGPHKTGTTALQKFLLDNQAELFKQNLVYPKRHIKIFGHHAFRDLIVNRQLDNEQVQFFTEQAHDFLLSSEDFISLSKDDFVYLKQAFETMQIKVVYSWRRASYKLYSIWQEVIKHGGTVDFFSYYHDHLARPAMSQMLSPDLKLGMFCQVFGRANVSVIDYEASAANNSLLQDFIASIGRQWSRSFALDDSNAHAKNASMKLHDVEIVRALNARFAASHKTQGSAVRHAYMQHKAQLPAVASEAINALEQAINGSIRTLSIGNYFIDARSEKVMQDKFASNMINYHPRLDAKALDVSTSEWLLSQRVNEQLNLLAEHLSEHLVN